MSCQRTNFPFSAIVGQERMKKALVLNAINQKLGGVLIRGQKGTAKSTAVRALANLLPPIEVVADCPFHCNPHERNEMCGECRSRIDRKETVQVQARPMRVVELPLGATEDRLLGTLDIESAIKKGEKKFEPGILAAAHRGILYVDEVNLLDDHLVDVLLDSAAMGVNTVEREGISFSHPARFMLIGTMNPEEGELRPQLLDRFGLCVDVEGIDDPEDRMDVVRRYLRYEDDPHGFLHEWEDDERMLCGHVVAARKLITEVTYDDDILGLITAISIDMNVDGHRSDIAMLKTAQTIAAYHERNAIIEDDVREAAELVLPHRMRRRPFQESNLDKEKLEQTMQNHKRKEPPPPSGNNDEEVPEKKKDHKEHGEKSGGGKPDGSTEVTFAAAEPYAVQRIEPDRDRRTANTSGRRSCAVSEKRSGRYARARIPGKEKTTDIAFDATLRAAAPHQKNRDRRDVALSVTSSDLREKVRERKTGCTMVFVVDASGSMGANRRMEAAKGAVLSLLVDAYRKRDRIAMIAFKGNGAEILLPPTDSIELGKRMLDVLPTGGKTPLAEGMRKGLELLTQEMKKNLRQKPVMVLLSDGRANAGSPHGTDPFRDALLTADAISKAGITPVVIDTESGLVRLGKMRQLADKMNAKYFPMEQLRAGEVAELFG